MGRMIGTRLAADGIPVLAINSLGYFRQHHTANSIGFVLLLAAMGFFALHRLLLEVRFHDVRAAFHPSTALAAFCS